MPDSAALLDNWVCIEGTATQMHGMACPDREQVVDWASEISS